MHAHTHSAPARSDGRLQQIPEAQECVCESLVRQHPRPQAPQAAEGTQPAGDHCWGHHDGPWGQCSRLYWPGGGPAQFCARYVQMGTLLVLMGFKDTFFNGCEICVWTCLTPNLSLRT